MYNFGVPFNFIALIFAAKISIFSHRFTQVRGNFIPLRLCALFPQHNGIRASTLITLGYDLLV